VLHPEKYFSGEAPRVPDLAYAPPGGRMINEGVLGEILIRTFLGEGSGAAAAGWGGDLFRVFDVSGRTLLVWASGWDTPADAREFAEAARARFLARYGPPRADGAFQVFTSGDWRFALAEQAGRVLLVSSDDASALQAALVASSPAAHLDNTGERPGY